MEERARRILKFLLRLFITAVLLGLVVNSFDIEELWRAISRVRLQFFLPVFALSIFSLWMRSYRFHLILKILNCSVTTSKVFVVSSVTMLYSLVLPGLVSTGVKWYILKEQTGKSSNVLSSMLYNQLTDIAVRILLALVALAIAAPIAGLTLPIIALTLALIMVAGFFLILSNRTGKPMGRVLHRLAKHLPRKAAEVADKIVTQVSMFRKANAGFHIFMAALSSVGFLFGVGVFIFAARAAGITVPVLALIWLSAAIYVLGRLPITIANCGVREWTLVGFMALYGVDAPSALLMSLVIFSCNIFMAAIGAVFQIAWAVRKKRPV